MFKFEIFIDPAEDELDENGEIKEAMIEKPNDEQIQEMTIALEDFVNDRWPRMHIGEVWGVQFTSKE